PPEVRLEVVINHVIHGDLRKVTADACHQIINAHEGSIAEVGPFTLRVSRVGSPVLSSDCDVQIGKIRVGSTPTGILPETNYLRVSSPWMERKIRHTMGSLINEAHSQLPPDRPGVIFIDGSRDLGLLSAEVRLTQPEYAHCFAIGIFLGDEIVFARRKLDE